MDSCFSFDLSGALPGGSVGVKYPWDEHILPDIPPIVGDQFFTYTLPYPYGGIKYGANTYVAITSADLSGGYQASPNTQYSDVKLYTRLVEGLQPFDFSIIFESPIPFVPGEPVGLTVFTKITAPTVQPEMTGGGPGYIESMILEDGTSQLLVNLGGKCSPNTPITFLVTVVATGRPVQPTRFWTRLAGTVETP